MTIPRALRLLPSSREFSSAPDSSHGLPVAALRFSLKTAPNASLNSGLISLGGA